jgi:hypothetical protein
MHLSLLRALPFSSPSSQFLLRLGVRAASNSAYSGYPELWILRYPAHRYPAGIRTHNPLVEGLDVLTIRRRRFSQLPLHATISPSRCVIKALINL